MLNQNITSDAMNVALKEGSEDLTGLLAAEWLEGMRDAYEESVECSVHIFSEQYWDNVIADLNDHPCSYYVLGSVKDDRIGHCDSSSNPWAMDVLDSFGNYAPILLTTHADYLMIVDEAPFYEDEDYSFVDSACGGITLGEDGFIVDEIVFGSYQIDSILFSQINPAQAIRLWAWDSVGNWKRSEDLVQKIRDQFNVKALTFYGTDASGLVKLSYCDSPLVSRRGTGTCTLNLVAWGKGALPPDYIVTHVSNDTDEFFPPDSPQVIHLPLYPVPHGSALYASFETLFNCGAQDCHNEFFTRGPDVSCPPMMVHDLIPSIMPQDPQDKTTQPVLWVSQYERDDWFTPEQQKDCTNAYSTEHKETGSNPYDHVPPIDYGSSRGLYHSGCSENEQYREDNIPDIFLAGSAYIYAWVDSLPIEADIGVQSEADILYICSHFDLNNKLDAADWNGFSPFKAITPQSPDYPGTSTDHLASDFYWSDLDGYFVDDTEWIATTACNSLGTDYPQGLNQAHQLILDGYLVSISGVGTISGHSIYYPVVADFSSRLDSCDGSYDPDLWFLPAPTTDCNVISWMETYCQAARNSFNPKLPDNLSPTMNARAIDYHYMYRIRKMHFVEVRRLSWATWYESFDDFYIFNTWIY